MTRLPSPEVTRTEEALRSTTFGDIYFQEADGLAETRHVFLDGNDLGRCFAALSGPRPFVIGELGFGTGLNFLAACALFARIAPPEARLEYWSIEGFPFAPDKLATILQSIAHRWPDIAPQAELLVAIYPQPRPGLAQLHLSERITLTLAFGDVEDMLDRTNITADAWFLDGFSPSCNPDMWREEVLARVADHTAPGGSFATFTVAGVVRRGLEKSGFTLERRPGFGKKREMLAGRISKAPDNAPHLNKIAILGAGIAGACAAFLARRAGVEVTVIDPKGAASGASGNPGGLVMPRIEAVDNPAARFYRDAYFYALRFYAAYCPSALIPCGGVLRGDQARFDKTLDTGLWHDDDLHATNGELHAATACLLKPHDAVQALLSDIKITPDDITSFEETDHSVRLRHNKGQIEADAVIVAAGPASAKLLGLTRDISASRGQVDLFSGPNISRILTDGTYIAPLGEQLIAGATYTPAALDEEVQANPDSTELNREAATTLLGQATGQHVSRRASLRATTTDRHPILGQVGDSKVRAFTGLGSRGLVTAPILAAHLMASITGGVSPLEKEGINLLAPSRFADRRARRGID